MIACTSSGHRPGGDAAPHDVASVDAASIDAAPSDAALPLHVLINFDDLPTGTDVTTQISSAAFSTVQTGQVNRTSDAGGIDFGQSPPNFLCTADTSINCINDTVVSFTNPVSHLTLRAIQANSTGTVAVVKVYVMSTLASSVPVIGTGLAQAPPVLVDLSQFANVTRIELTAINDTGGIGWDDLSFTVP